MTAGSSTFPASFAQRRLWFIQHFAPQSTAYNMVMSARLPEGVDAAILQRGLERLCEQHEALRTRFEVAEGDVVQIVESSGALPLSAHEGGSRRDFPAVVSASAAEPFVLDRAPLVRAHADFSPGSPPLLALIVHHIVADAITLQILVEDLQALLHGSLQGHAVQLSRSPIEYADFAVWQRRWLSGKRLQALTDYWVGRLKGMPELELPRRRRFPAAPGNTRGEVVRLRLEPAVCQRVRVMAADSHTTVFSVLLAAFSAVVGRFAGQRDFGIGIPVSGRNRVELERVAGLFVNSIVFRATSSEGVSFAALVRATTAALAEDFSHQEMAFEKVVDALRVRRLVDRNPLFQVMVQLQTSEPASQVAAPSLSVAPDLIDPQQLSAQLDLSLMLFDAHESGIHGGVVFAVDRVDPEWVAQLATAFTAAVTAASRDPEQSIDRLPLLDDAGRRAVLALAEGPRRSWPAEALLHDGFARVAARQPNTVAICAGTETVSFADLDGRAAALAARMQQHGLRPGDTLAICSARSADAVTAMLAASRCGGAYLVIDPATPRSYRESVLEDSEARLVAVPAGREDWSCGRPALELSGREPLDDPSSASPAAPAGATAYLIYTSGSTGHPKGVRIPHASIINHMCWMLDRFEIGPGDRVLQRTPLTFDASVWEVWAPLLSGATLVLADDDGPFDPGRLAQQIRRDRITTLQVVPTLLRTLLPQARHGELASLRLLFCGGEILPPELVRDARTVCDATVVNLYGPTETTIDATFHVCSGEAAGADTDDVPIGRPIANTAAYVLDDQLQPLPWGVTGELCIGGAAVGMGYQRRPALTAERFVDDPFARGGRLYRTGDRAVMARDGTLHYRGRRDHQVKLRGFRLELGDVEARLTAHPAVAQAAAVVQDDTRGEQRLVAFVTLDDTAAPVTGSDLIASLRGQLPAYAVPSTVAVLADLPRTSHGKIDRALLRSHPCAPAARDVPWHEPATPLEQLICASFARHLSLDRAGVEDDFFLRGGHSLLVISLCDELTRVLAVPVGVVDVFEFPTPRLLAGALEHRFATVATSWRPDLAAGGVL